MVNWNEVGDQASNFGSKIASALSDLLGLLVNLAKGSGQLMMDGWEALKSSSFGQFVSEKLGISTTATPGGMASNGNIPVSPQVNEAWRAAESAPLQAPRPVAGYPRQPRVRF